MDDGKRYSLIKPTLQTPFHIDFDWWKQHDSNWRVYLQSYLCDECSETYKDYDEENLVDWVDPDTGEVKQVDGLLHALISHCANQPGFITDHTTMVDSVFRYFIANGNKPLTPIELSEGIGKPATTILRTFTGSKVFKGIRPIRL